MRLIFIFFWLIFSWAIAQCQTVGLIDYNKNSLYDGYTLLYPHNQPDVLMINRCGQIVQRWQGAEGSVPGNTAYPLSGGRILMCARSRDISQDRIWAGGGGDRIEIRDALGQLTWSYALNTDQARLHHDIAVTPDETILAILWELKDSTESIAAGRNPALMDQGELWPDAIIEIRPVGTDSADIVWEWHSWDHLIQDYDDTKDNYGIISENPGKINLNYDTSNGHPDWQHSNAIDYQADADLILLSVPTFSEIWIIDHSTTTEEARGSTGGDRQAGGDLLWRWGNPAAYGRGTAADQQLFYQHDASWIDDYLNPSFPDFGLISVFNNRVSDTASTALVLNPGYDMYNFSYEFTMQDGVWLPQDPVWSYQLDNPEFRFSNIMSSIQRLPNGNTLLSTGRYGYCWEITPNRDIVWQYRVPLRGGEPVEQGTELSINNNLLFRARRIPLDAPILDDLDLTPMGYWELNPDTSFCNTITSIDDLTRRGTLEIYPNPSDAMITLEWDYAGLEEFIITDLLGRIRLRDIAQSGRHWMNVMNLEAGIYTIHSRYGGTRRLVIRE